MRITWAKPERTTMSDRTVAADPLERAARAYIAACEGNHPDPDTAMSRLVHAALELAPVIGITPEDGRTVDYRALLKRYMACVVADDFMVGERCASELVGEYTTADLEALCMVLAEVTAENDESSVVVRSGSVRER
jgi:hypothetical protein